MKNLLLILVIGTSIALSAVTYVAYAKEMTCADYANPKIAFAWCRTNKDRSLGRCLLL